jgi:hypothetical protein
VKSPRSGKTLSTHELARFLSYLADSGNFALACDRLGRAKSGLYKRRARDPLFAADCVAALAQHRSSSSPGRGGGPPKAVEGALFPHQPLKTSWNMLTLSTHRGRPQLRRAVSGCLTRAGLDAFLKTLAATGNIRFAAHSVGVAPSSIYYRRRRDPAFACDMDIALDAALANLELRLIEATGVFDENPSPLAGEGESAELTGERDCHAQGVRGTAEHGNNEPAHREPYEGFTTRMTVSEAIRLVGRLERKLAQR